MVYLFKPCEIWNVRERVFIVLFKNGFQSLEQRHAVSPIISSSVNTNRILNTVLLFIVSEYSINLWSLPLRHLRRHTRWPSLRWHRGMALHCTISRLSLLIWQTYVDLVLSVLRQCLDWLIYTYTEVSLVYLTDF